MAIKFNRVNSSASATEANSVYFVAETQGANKVGKEIIVVGSDGTKVSFASLEVIDKAIEKSLKSANSVEVVADIPARDALKDTLKANASILVKDATGDSTVKSGAALYVFQKSDKTFTKIAEYESMDLEFTWSNIQNIPQLNITNEDKGSYVEYTLSVPGSSAAGSKINVPKPANELDWTSKEW